MKITAKIITIFFHSNDTDYSIAKAATDDQEITVCGYFPLLKEDMTYSFEGEYINHPKYGKQFKVSTYQQVTNNSREGVINYLSSEIFKGIGLKTAEMIYDSLGENCLEKIIEDKTCLESLGMTKVKTERIRNTLLENKRVETTLVGLYQMGLSSRMATKIISIYQMEALEKIKENPYRLIKDIEGYGFTRADEIAINIGIPYDNPLRIKASIVFSLENISKTYGYTHLYISQLIDSTFDFLLQKKEVEKKIIEKHISVLIQEKELILENDKVFLPQIYSAEISICKDIKSLRSPKNSSVEKVSIMQAIERTEFNQNMKYNDRQKEAILMAVQNPISIITGGPGTGKTTVIKGFLSVYKMLYTIDEDTQIGLMAPTGRAAKRLFETTKLISGTIHRHLKMDYNGTFTHNRDNAMVYNLIIIDESSMIDVFLAKSLFEAIKKDCKVVIVGDVDQLPSVGPGMVLHDLIASNSIPLTRLDVVQRQAEGSSIISLAQMVCKGTIEEEVFKDKDDLYFYPCHTSDVPNVIDKFISRLIKLGYSLLEDIQVLIPMYKGPAGIDIVNTLIKNKYNTKKVKEISNSNRSFKKEDKVLQLVNNVKKGVMNGDMGIVLDVITSIEDGESKEYLKVDFDGAIVHYAKEELDELTLAYAMSIHKSQGSEYRVVIMPLVKNYSVMLKRKLIYTGITRAKEKLIIIGDYESLQLGVQSCEDNRQTTLAERLSMNKSEKKLNLQDVPFEFFGEDLADITPYDFLEKEEK